MTDRLHDHQADADALHDALVDACQKHLLDNFDWQKHMPEIVENCDITTLESALVNFINDSGLMLMLMLNGAAWGIAEREAIALVKRWGKDWLVALECSL